MSDIQVGDIGTVIKVTITDETGAVVNLSSASTKQIILQPPFSGHVVKDAQFYSNGTDGILKYTTISGDISEAGEWGIQAYVAFTTGSWHSSTATFSVNDNI